MKLVLKVDPTNFGEQPFFLIDGAIAFQVGVLSTNGFHLMKENGLTVPIAQDQVKKDYGFSAPIMENTESHEYYFISKLKA